MKGIITLKSENHSGEYKFDTETRSFVRVFKKIEDPTLYRVGETFDIDFYLNTEVKRIPEWKEKWIILSGSGRDISADYTKEAPLGLYHTNDIYDVLDQKDPDDFHFITFTAFPPSNGYMRKSIEYKTFRKYQVPIMSDLFEIDRSEIALLPDIDPLIE